MNRLKKALDSDEISDFEKTQLLTEELIFRGISKMDIADKFVFEYCYQARTGVTIAAYVEQADKDYKALKKLSSYELNYEGFQDDLQRIKEAFIKRAQPSAWEREAMAENFDLKVAEVEMKQRHAAEARQLKTDLSKGIRNRHLAQLDAVAKDLNYQGWQEDVKSAEENLPKLGTAELREATRAMRRKQFVHDMEEKTAAEMQREHTRIPYGPPPDSVTTADF